MTDKFRKTARRFILSDSTVNVYGFRLLTSGYQVEEFRKNPIGYYMHRREEGIALKWEDIEIDGDQVTGVPVINLANSRGEQTCDEVEHGFLNAASVGHIVVLEYSTDPELMLPGQTGPTITKWYNKECSLVDIPGNCNALTTLYDLQENPLNLADFSSPLKPIIVPENLAWDEVKCLLQLEKAATNEAVVLALRGLDTRVQNLVAGNTNLASANQQLQQQLDDLMASHRTQQVTELLSQALSQNKLTLSLHDRLAVDYAHNPDGLQELLAAMPAYISVTAALKARQDTTEATWAWDDYEKNDPTGKRLKDLRNNNPAKYQELFEGKFGG